MMFILYIFLQLILIKIHSIAEEFQHINIIECLLQLLHYTDLWITSEGSAVKLSSESPPTLRARSVDDDKTVKLALRSTLEQEQVMTWRPCLLYITGT